MSKKYTSAISFGLLIALPIACLTVINAEVEVAIDEEDTYAIIDDGIVKIIPNYHYLKNGKEVTYPITSV